MSEPTFATFQAAAREAAQNIDGKPAPAPSEDRVRLIIEEVLAAMGADTQTPERELAEKVAKRLHTIMWPEFEFEVRKREHEQQVDREAANRYISQEIRRYLKERTGAGKS